MREREKRLSELQAQILEAEAYLKSCSLRTTVAIGQSCLKSRTPEFKRRKQWSFNPYCQFNHTANFCTTKSWGWLEGTIATFQQAIADCSQANLPSETNLESASTTSSQTLSQAVLTTAIVRTSDENITNTTKASETLSAQNESSDAAPTMGQSPSTVSPERNTSASGTTGLPMSSPTNSTNIILPVVITLIVITLSVFSLVALYKMCQKKTPERQENGAEQAQSDKEGVKLLSVKTTSPETVFVEVHDIYEVGFSLPSANLSEPTTPPPSGEVSHGRTTGRNQAFLMPIKCNPLPMSSTTIVHYSTFLFPRMRWTLYDKPGEQTLDILGVVVSGAP
ncbi:hypothetical protein TURU_098054 [Turdus rufiventris]|nr:hypothetical protein TURU_098054 [Turdus rufiventris]